MTLGGKQVVLLHTEAYARPAPHSPRAVGQSYWCGWLQWRPRSHCLKPSPLKRADTTAQHHSSTALLAFQWREDMARLVVN